MAINRIYTAIFIALLLWFLMFSPWTAPFINFWLAMSCSGFILLILCYFLGEDWRTQLSITPNALLLGLSSAIVLWGIFYLGHYLSTELFTFAKPQINTIYSLREGTNPTVIALLLLLIIGPAETFFWQGLIQRVFMKTWGNWQGFLLTTLIYTLVHIWSFNLMLLMAAAICGAFWGILYMHSQPRNLVPLIISHSVWDVLVFIILPIS